MKYFMSKLNEYMLPFSILFTTYMYLIQFIYLLVSKNSFSKMLWQKKEKNWKQNYLLIFFSLCHIFINFTNVIFMQAILMNI